MMRDLDLGGPWKFRQAGRAGLRVKRWLPAVVPGTVHTDLLAAGEIEDPFFRANELEQGWVEQADWAYLREFRVAPEFLAEARALWLDFEGLDTLATVRLNGQVVGQAANMFHPWRFDAKPFVRAGANTLEVEFASAPRVAEELASKSRTQYRAAFYAPRVWLRKAQYSGGWDWGPRLLTCGIWRPVRLRAVSHAEIRSVHARTTELNEQRALLAVDVEIEAHISGRAVLSARLSAAKPAAGADPGGDAAAGRTPPKPPLVKGGKKRRGARALQAGASSAAAADATTSSAPLVASLPAAAASARSDVDLAHGTQLVSLHLEVPSPAWWWPNGMGAQSLYDLEVTLEARGEVADTSTQTIGLRTLELVRERDGQGESFRFRVNGRDVFCKGANWIPGDSFLPRLTPDYYRRRLLEARDAHMNMLRVWGGGIYEDPAFYRTCDELGLMVWQDFMFACAEYPEDPALVESVRREAQLVVRRLRHHACLALWCGNNENHWFFDELWAPVAKRHGEAYYHDILPGVCREHDPQRAYWPGSPYGGPKANDPNHGDQHVWSVWASWMPPEHYRESPARFASEFGFQAMPAASTVRSFTAEADRRLFSPVIDHHNKAEDGHARIMKFLTHSLGPPADLDDYVYRSQVQQADAVKIGVEHWRRRWPASAGALFWQLNDCWPAASWSAVDYAGEPKALYYASRRCFAPTLVSLCPVTEVSCGLTALEVWLTHDGQDSPQARLEVLACTLDGKVLKSRTLQTHLPASGSERVLTLEPAALKLTDPLREFVYVRLTRGLRLIARNFHYFAPGKYVDWPDPAPRLKLKSADHGFEIELTPRRLARGVCLSAPRWPGAFADNFFDLMPGEPYHTAWSAIGPAPPLKTFQAALNLCWLGGR